MNTVFNMAKEINLGGMAVPDREFELRDEEKEGFRAQVTRHKGRLLNVVPLSWFKPWGNYPSF